MERRPGRVDPDHDRDVPAAVAGGLSGGVGGAGEETELARGLQLVIAIVAILSVFVTCWAVLGSDESSDTGDSPGEPISEIDDDVIVEEIVERGAEITAGTVVGAQAPARCQGWVALTFDDGPVGGEDAGSTSRLVEELDRLGVPATFFMLGREMAEWPEAVEAVLARGAGGGIGNHGWDHQDFRGLTRGQVNWQLSETARVYDAIVGAGGAEGVGVGGRLEWWRPPYGAATGADARWAREAGGVETLWTVDARDWETGVDAETVVRRAQGMQDGGVLLLHEGHPATVEALEEIVESYWSKGMCWGVLGASAEAQTPQESPAMRFYVKAVEPGNANRS